MPINEIHVFDSSTTFEIQLLDEEGDPVSVQNTEDLVLFFQKPNGVIISKDVTKVGSGSDGRVRYTTNETDLDQVGTWKYQLYADGKHSDIGTFRVYPNLPTE